MNNGLNEYLVGQELISKLTVLPKYKNNLINPSERLIALLDIYNIYIPNSDSVNIYNRLYMSLYGSLEKKKSIYNIKLLNDNFRSIKGQKRYGIIGGFESFKITGNAGLGKTSTIERCSEIITNKIIINESPHMEIIPILFIECVADGSFKSLLYMILQQVDRILGTNFFIANKHNTTTVDVLLAAVSNVLINHVALLVIDEIERVANDSKKGDTLINYLTQLVNQSNIAICFVGNESANRYFERKEYMSRRTIGISMTKMAYDVNYFEFVKTLFNYQYVINKVEFNSEYARFIYKLTNGIPSMIISLFVEAQKQAIISGIEKLDCKLIEKVFNDNFSNMNQYLDVEDKKNYSKRKQELIIANNPIDNEKDLFGKFYKATNKDYDKFVVLLKDKVSVEFI